MCLVVVLAAKSGALLLIEPLLLESGSSWPPKGVVELLQGTAGRCCGYMAVAGACDLGFTHRNPHRVRDLQQLARGYAPLGDIVRDATGKRFGLECFALYIDPLLEESVYLGEYRLRLAVFTAVATLAGFDVLGVEGDERVAEHAMHGYGELVDVLTARTPFFQ